MEIYLESIVRNLYSMLYPILILIQCSSRRLATVDEKSCHDAWVTLANQVLEKLQRTNLFGEYSLQAQLKDGDRLIFQWNDPERTIPPQRGHDDHLLACDTARLPNIVGLRCCEALETASKLSRIPATLRGWEAEWNN